METRDKCETGVGVVLHNRLKNKSPLTNSAVRSCQVARAITSARCINIDLIMLLIAVVDSRYAMAPAESQKPCQRVSNADRKVFANPESFCDKFIIG